MLFCLHLMMIETVALLEEKHYDNAAIRHKLLVVYFSSNSNENEQRHVLLYKSYVCLARSIMANVILISVLVGQQKGLL